MVQRIKTSAKRGMRKAALKVVDRMKEETVDEAVYGGGERQKSLKTSVWLSPTLTKKVTLLHIRK